MESGSALKSAGGDRRPHALAGTPPLGATGLRAILENINVMVIPEQVAIPRAFEAFQAGGSLKDPKQQAMAAQVGARLVQVLAKLEA